MYIVLSRIDRIGIGSAHPLKILASFPYLWPGATKFLLDSLQQGHVPMTQQKLVHITQDPKKSYHMTNFDPPTTHMTPSNPEGPPTPRPSMTSALRVVFFFTSSPPPQVKKNHFFTEWALGDQNQN